MDGSERREQVRAHISLSCLILKPHRPQVLPLLSFLLPTPSTHLRQSLLSPAPHPTLRFTKTLFLSPSPQPSSPWSFPSPPIPSPGYELLR